MTPAEHRIRLHEVEDEFALPMWWASCKGCDWIYGPISNDEDVLIDAHEAHRKAQP